MAEVFISFIHEEELVAPGVAEFLSNVLGEAVKPFMSSDTSAIYAGERWMDRIVEELKGAKVVVAILSPVSVQRPWVNFEAGAAWITDKIIIPVCFKGLIKDGLPKPYSSLQAVNLDNLDDQEYLVKSVAHHLQLPAPPAKFGLFRSREEQSKIDGPYEALRMFLESC